MESKMTQNMELLTPDFCVIGGGSGGLSFAYAASQMGATVVLVEGRQMGGDCLNFGCVPSKSLLAAAKIGHDIRGAKEFGWTARSPKINFKKVKAHIKSVINAIAPNDSVDRFEKLGVRVVQEMGHFVDAKTVETPSTRIRAKRFIIAVGSMPFIPPIHGLSDIQYETNETIFDLPQLPIHLCIIGGGPIGIEMAQAFNRLGSLVTVLESGSILPKNDFDMTSDLKKILIHEGITIVEGAQILSVQKDDFGAVLMYRDLSGQDHHVIASNILVAAGRRAAIDTLNVTAAGIDATSRGIVVDKCLRTTNKRVYAIGDCIGGYQFTHMAGYHAGLVIRNSIFGLRSKVQQAAVPFVTYTDPELAHVGLSKRQLDDDGRPYRTLTMPFHDNDRAVAARKTAGKINVFVSPKGVILGATILGANAGELIYPWVVAIQNTLSISAIASSIAPYPTFTEISKRAAGTYYIDRIFGSRMKKIVRFLMKIRR